MAATPQVVLMPTYEFTEKQNAIIYALASRMRVVGAGLLVAAALLALRTVLAGGEFSALFWILVAGLGCIGFWSLRASDELRRVVLTEGADVPHLMGALTEIRKLYDVQYWIIVVAALLATFTVVAAVVGKGMLPAVW